MRFEPVVMDRLPARPDVRMQRRRKPCDRDTPTNVAETARFRTPRANGASNTLDDAPHRFQVDAAPHADAGHL